MCIGKTEVVSLKYDDLEQWCDGKISSSKIPKAVKMNNWDE